MPTYDYICTNCSHQEEFFQKITDPSFTECPQCHLPALKRGPGGGIGLKFVGSGFYITDYCSSEKKDSTCSCKKPSDLKP